jgi:DNA-binding NtrC family response regulator
VAAKILVVDDELAMRMGLQQVLKKEGYKVELAGDGQEALDRMAKESFDAIITDLRMPRQDGFSVLNLALSLNPQPLVIMITAYGDVPTAVQAMQKGATDFILKPFKIADVRTRVKTALIKRGIQEERGEMVRAQKAANPAIDEGDPNEDFTEIFSLFPEIITQCPGMGRVLKTVKKIARTDCTVLITGETGTGKELIAQSLHRLSHRNEGPLIATASMTESIVESELFGHRKGAFTGAHADKAGFFEASHNGTLFLDEVGDLPLSIQVKLLRVIQESEIIRVGESSPRKISVRLVAATWRDLRQMIQEKQFREDLYFRLNVITIWLPPLRERPGDLPLLLKELLDTEAKKLGVPVPKLEKSAIDLLEKHPWQGNIRELKSCCTRLAIYGGAEIDEEAVKLALDDDS